MATDATLLDTGGDGLSSANVVTASVSPSANAHLVLFTGGAGNFGAGAWAGALVTGGGLTWTAVEADGGADFVASVGVYTAQCGASPGSFAVTWDGAGGNWHDTLIFALWEVTGGDQVTGAVAQGDQEGDGAVDLVLAATPASGDAVLVFCYVDHATSGASSALSGTWQDEHDFSTNEGQAYGGGNTAWRNDMTSATVSWTDVHVGSTDNFGSSQAGVIITAAGGGGGGLTPQLRGPIRTSLRLR